MLDVGPALQIFHVHSMSLLTLGHGNDAVGRPRDQLLVVEELFGGRERAAPNPELAAVLVRRAVNNVDVAPVRGLNLSAVVLSRPHFVERCQPSPSQIAAEQPSSGVVESCWSRPEVADDEKRKEATARPTPSRILCRRRCVACRQGRSRPCLFCSCLDCRIDSIDVKPQEKGLSRTQSRLSHFLAVLS